MGSVRDSEIEVILRLISSGNYDKEIAQMMAAKQASKDLSTENANLSKSSATTEGELQKLGDRHVATAAESKTLADALAQEGKTVSDTEAATRAMNQTLQETGSVSTATEQETAKLSETLKSKLQATSRDTAKEVELVKNQLVAAGLGGKNLDAQMQGLFTTLNKPRILEDLKKGFSDMGLAAEDAGRAAKSVVNDVVSQLSALDKAATSGGGGGLFSQVSQGLTQATAAIGSFVTSIGDGAKGIPLLGGAIGGIIGPIGNLTTALGALGPLGAIIVVPMLAAVAVALGVLAINIGSVVLALAAMIATFIAATFVLTAFGVALFGVLGMLAIAAAPIVLLTVALDAMSASQAQAAQTATQGLQQATQAYTQAQLALKAAQASQAVPNAQAALNAANQQLAVAQHNVGVRPGSIGAQGALSQAQIAQSNAAKNLQQAQIQQAQQLQSAQNNLNNATQNLAKAQTAYNQANLQAVDAFAKLDVAVQKMLQTWVNAAAPVMAQIQQALIGILPLVQQLGLDIIKWFSGEAPTVIKDFKQTFSDFIEILRAVGGVFGSFFDQALQRFPGLESIFKEFGMKMVDALKGVLDNLIRLSDWFIKEQPTLQPVIEAILSGLGRGVQGFFDQVAKFISYVVANWPTIKPVFENAISSIIGFFGGLWDNFSKLIVWLDQTFPTAQKNASSFLDKLGTDIQYIGTALDQTGKFLQALQVNWEKVWNALQPIFKAFGDGFNSSFGKVAPVLQALLGPLQDAWNEFDRSLGGSGGSQGILQLLEQFAYWMGQLEGITLGGAITTFELLAIAILKVATAITEIIKAMAQIPSGNNNIVFQVIGALATSGGSLLPKFGDGGMVPGAGSGDTVPALLTPGEGVLNRGAMASIGGAAGLAALNRGGSLGGDSARLAAIEGHLAALVSKAMGTTVVNATAIDYRALAREITKQQKFAASTGTI